MSGRQKVNQGIKQWWKFRGILVLKKVSNGLAVWDESKDLHLIVILHNCKFAWEVTA